MLEGSEQLKIEQALEQNGEIMTSSAGVSMYPMLRNRRDMIVIKKLDRPLKKYDVPLYRISSGKLVMHRILKVTDGGYIIRGDNRFEKETNITDDNIIGVLKCFYRNGRFVDCETDKGYKLYIRYVMLSYPFRWFYRFKLRPFLSKVKRLFIKK